MKFTIEIEMGNDAMQTGRDVAEALRAVAHKLDGHVPDEDYGNRIRDINGNTVGEWGFREVN